MIQLIKKNPWISAVLGIALLSFLIWLIYTLLHKGWLSPINGTYVTSPFGMRSSGEFHNGVDLHAPMYTPIRAPRDGVIEYEYTASGGTQILVKHKDGYTTGYAHLSSREVPNGSSVKRGAVIAYSGNSGTHTNAPHLHFTLTDPLGNKIDPQPVFNFA